MKKINGLILSALTAAFLVGCGGGGGSSSSGPTTSTGTFVDAPVKGLHYKTATQEGDTNENGEFKYIAGETIEFKLGNLSLGSVNADGLITPYTLAGDTDISNPSNVATNIALLLQNFDADRADGILDITNIKDMDLSSFKVKELTPLEMEAKISLKFVENDFVTTSKIGSTTLINSDTAKTEMKKYVAQAKLTTSIVSGKQIVLNDGEGDVTLIFNTNGTYSESGFDADTKSNYTCSGKWLDFGNNKIATTCEKDGTSNLPTESDTTFQFTTLTDGTKVTVKGDVDTTPFEATIVSSANISTSSSTSSSSSSTSVTTSFISGKIVLATGYDNQMTATFNANGTYSESYVGSLASSVDKPCSGQWKDLGNNKIGVTCEENGTSVIPDSEASSTTNILQFTSNTPVAGDKITVTESGKEPYEMPINIINNIQL